MKGRGSWSNSVGTKSEGNDRWWNRYPNISSVWQKIRRLFPPDPRYLPTRRQKPRLPPYPLVPLGILVSVFFGLRTQDHISSRTKFTARLFTSQRGASILQQTQMTMDLINSGGVPPPLPAPRAQLTPAKASLFKRLSARIMHRKPASRIGTAGSPSART